MPHQELTKPWYIGAIIDSTSIKSAFVFITKYTFLRVDI